MKLEFLVDQDEIKVKDFLLEKGISRAFGRKVKLYGEIYINGELAKNYYNLKKNDKLLIIVHEESLRTFPISMKELEIVYEDQYLLVINKPSDLSVQPSRKHSDDNVISRLIYYFQNQGISSNIHLVNRLDYATSGLMIVAKEGYIHHQLTKNKMQRRYLAKVTKTPPDVEGTLCFPIEREKPYSIRQKISPTGKYAVTHYRVIKDGLLALQLETGRTHQIRLHLAHIGSPIVGDVLYGTKDKQLYLHCCFIGFTHPITQKNIEISNQPDWT